MAAKLVKGEGPKNAKLVFVGECPGKTEIKLGRPFVGRAGKFLDKQLKKFKIDRKKVYITNVVKQQHEGPPPPEIVRKYLPALTKELSQLRKAKIIVLLGKTAARNVPLINDATYIELPHPSAAMRFTKMRKKFEAGMKQLQKITRT
jgi:DNA polymerase